jgi:hypothetical protein
VDKKTNKKVYNELEFVKDKLFKEQSIQQKDRQVLFNQLIKLKESPNRCFLLTNEYQLDYQRRKFAYAINA